MSVRIVLLLLIAFLVPLPWQAAADSAPPAAVDEHPLAPADTSSPRATLFGFMVNVSNALQAWQRGEPRQTVESYAGLAYQAFDFSRLPPENQLARKIETALFLKEILDRIELPPADEIPGDNDMANKERAVTKWTIPNTSITIEKLRDGPRAGEFLFTAETVDRLEDLYQRAKQLPYKPGAMVGILDTFLHSPGIIVPHAWAAALPAWSRTIILDKAMWQWLTLVIVLIGAWLTVRLLLWCGRRWDKRHRGVATRRFGTPLAVLAGIGVVYAARIAVIYGTKFYGPFWDSLSSVLWTVIFFGLAWFVVLVSGRVAEAINEARRFKEGSIDSQLFRVLMRLISLTVLVCLVVYAAGFFGVPLTPVIASLGVGGLAIALAVRPTVENIIGGLTLFADKPVRIGDFCRFGNEDATVEAIGLRSTRLRKQDDTLVTVPNADFSQRELTNYTQRRQRLYRTTLGLRYETAADQLRYVIAHLREMLLGHPMVSPEKLHVRFDGFGAYSLDVEIFAYIRTLDWLEYRAVREDINFRIIDIVNDAGTGFAFPSQTTYLGRDSGLNAERAREAEANVKQWRSKGRLPFPEFDPALQWEKEGILDYPPKGSPGYVPRAGVPEPLPEALEEPPPPRDAPSTGWKRFLRRARG